MIVHGRRQKIVPMPVFRAIRMPQTFGNVFSIISFGWLSIPQDSKHPPV